MDDANLEIAEDLVARAELTTQINMSARELRPMPAVLRRWNVRRFATTAASVVAGGIVGWLACRAPSITLTAVRQWRALVRAPPVVPAVMTCALAGLWLSPFLYKRFGLALEGATSSVSFPGTPHDVENDVDTVVNRHGLDKDLYVEIQLHLARCSRNVASLHNLHYVALKWIATHKKSWSQATILHELTRSIPVALQHDNFQRALREVFRDPSAVDKILLDKRTLAGQGVLDA